jgi:hypothetical protein
MRSTPVGRAVDGTAACGFVLLHTGNAAYELMAADEPGRDFRVGLASEEGSSIELDRR